MTTERNAIYTIEIACDHTEAAEFVAWLNAQGHDATVGDSTGSYVDGDCTDHDADASAALNQLWEAYCNA